MARSYGPRNGSFGKIPGVEPPNKILPDRKPISLKWTYKLKTDDKGKITQYKARIVCRGFTERYGVDDWNTFAPTGRLETLRVFLAPLAADRHSFTRQ